MARMVSPQLMFEGAAEEAMNLYVSLYADSAVGHVERYGPGEAGAEGSVKRATFTVAGQPMACIDSPIAHGFSFTPSLSLFVECESEAELQAAYDRLLEGGQALMPVGSYGFGTRFGWVSDRFGVSWQLNLA